jgi:hypothetical protein
MNSGAEFEIPRQEQYKRQPYLVVVGTTANDNKNFNVESKNGSISSNHKNTNNKVGGGYLSQEDYLSSMQCEESSIEFSEAVYVNEFDRFKFTTASSTVTLKQAGKQQHQTNKDNEQPTYEEPFKVNIPNTSPVVNALNSNSKTTPSGFQMRASSLPSKRSTNNTTIDLNGVAASLNEATSAAMAILPNQKLSNDKNQQRNVENDVVYENFTKAYNLCATIMSPKPITETSNEKLDKATSKLTTKLQSDHHHNGNKDDKTHHLKLNKSSTANIRHDKHVCFFYCDA